MTAIDSVDGIALEKNWITMAIRLRAAMENYRDYGARAPQEVLGAVARAQGLHPTSLKKPLVAAAWLKDHHPDMFARRPAKLPVSQIMQLKSLHAFSPTKADEVAEAVFAATIPRHVLEEIIATERQKFIAANGGHERSVRPGPARVAKEFERKVEVYLGEHLEELAEGANAEVFRGDKMMPPVDFVIRCGDDLYMAVEAKAPRTAIHERHLLELLGLNLLRQRTIPYILVIGSPDWEPRLKRMVELAQELGLTGFTFAMLQDQSDPDGGVLKIIPTNPATDKLEQVPQNSLR